MYEKRISDIYINPFLNPVLQWRYNLSEEKELKVTKNDPHNPKKLLDRKRDSSKDGYDQDPSGWAPTPWNETGAGKGDARRPSSISREMYALRYDLAIGKLSKKEFELKVKGLEQN